MTVDEMELRRIEEIIRGEERPEDEWFVDTIQNLIDAIRASRKEVA